jgi:hypothetical protein
MLSEQRDFMRVDEFGFDPLLDQSYEAIEGVSSYQTQTVKAQEEFNPGLISFNYYRDVRWWRAIMVYNAIEDIWDIKAGMKVRIPDINEMTTRLQRVKAENTVATVVTF